MGLDKENRIGFTSTGAPCGPLWRGPAHPRLRIIEKVKIFYPPTFLGNIAYGIHNKGLGDDGIYMAINYISYLDLSVMTGSIFLPLVFSSESSQYPTTSESESTEPYPPPDSNNRSIEPTPNLQPIPYP